VPAWISADKFDITAKPDQPGFPTFKQCSRCCRSCWQSVSILSFTRRRGSFRHTSSRWRRAARRSRRMRPLVRLSAGDLIAGSWFAMRRWPNLPPLSCCRSWISQWWTRTGFGETRYSFILKFTPDPGVLPSGRSRIAQPPAPDADAPPDIFAAMEQQLGLHIQKTKAQVDVMVIDKVSKPSEN